MKFWLMTFMMFGAVTDAHARKPPAEEKFTVVFHRELRCPKAKAIAGKYGLFLECRGGDPVANSVYRATFFGYVRDGNALDALRKHPAVLAVAKAKPFRRQ